MTPANSTRKQGPQSQALRSEFCQSPREHPASHPPVSEARAQSPVKLPRLQASRRRYEAAPRALIRSLRCKRKPVRHGGCLMRKMQGRTTVHSLKPKIL